MIRVQREDFDVGAELAALAGDNHAIGGVCVFVGVVRKEAREETGEETLSAMTLEHYPGMTEKELRRIEAEARERWPLDGCLIIHRYGRLEPGQQIVLVATASSHRHAAFEACQFLTDWLKTKAPFWKLEESGQGPRWVEARDSDAAAAARWSRDAAAE